MSVIKFFGPPGTGKTYKLISRAKAHLRTGVPLNKIGYFAFTKKAAAEAKNRMPYNNKKLPYFQTLHSLAFHSLGLSEEMIMQPFHYEDLGKRLNIKVKFFTKQNEDDSFYLTCDNIYFQLINRAKNKDISIEEEYATNEYSREDIVWDILKTVNENLEVYKKKTNLIDFNDMVKNFISQKDKCPEFDVVIIDEAQDLSPIQWQMFDILKKKSKKMYLAGDDDQAIYAWAGADVDRFIKEPGVHKYLTQSKRIPRKVQEISKLPISRIIGLRQEKIYHPKKEEGLVQKIFDINKLNLHEGRWLILARTDYRLQDIKEFLFQKGIYFQIKKEKSFSVKLYNAVIDYTNWSRGVSLSVAKVKDIFDFLPYNIDKKFIENKTELIIDETGLKRNIKWFDIFTAKQQDKIYIRDMLSNGENLKEEARIRLSTIHAAKGGEEDNVIVILDNAKKIREAVQRSVKKRDEEHRVWYVAFTRAKKNLYLLRAKKERNGYQI